jgi:hypothetical protein
MTYQEATEYLSAGRDKHSRPLANNTRLEKRSAGVAIRLHGTDVATFLHDGGVQLYTGGWYTVTTKDRMNMAFSWPGWRLFQKQGEWFMHYGEWESGFTIPYVDGMTVWPDGRHSTNGNR